MNRVVVKQHQYIVLRGQCAKNQQPDHYQKGKGDSQSHQARKDAHTEGFLAGQYERTD